MRCCCRGRCSGVRRCLSAPENVTSVWLQTGGVNISWSHRHHDQHEQEQQPRPAGCRFIIEYRTVGGPPSRLFTAFLTTDVETFCTFFLVTFYVFNVLNYFFIFFCYKNARTNVTQNSILMILFIVCYVI